jgi:hypothetical protein
MARLLFLRPLMAESAPLYRDEIHLRGKVFIRAGNHGFQLNLSIYTRLRAAIALSIAVG